MQISSIIKKQTIHILSENEQSTFIRLKKGSPKLKKIKNRRVERDLENVNQAVVETVKSNLKQPERKNLWASFVMIFLARTIFHLANQNSQTLINNAKNTRR